MDKPHEHPDAYHSQDGKNISPYSRARQKAHVDIKPHVVLWIVNKEVM